MSADRIQAAIALREFHGRALRLADQIDPDQKRNYERDPILKALDAVTAAASHALYTIGASPTLHTDAEISAAVRRFKP